MLKIDLLHYELEFLRWENINLKKCIIVPILLFNLIVNIFIIFQTKLLIQ